MKVSIDIDCTPAEARAFFGLPDVAPLQAAAMDAAAEGMKAGLEGMDAEALMKMWMPAAGQGVEQFQKMFLAQMQAAAGKDGRK